jgi:sec-independent protein translocase protein TatC
VLFGAALVITAVHDKRAARRALHDTSLSMNP